MATKLGIWQQACGRIRAKLPQDAGSPSTPEELACEREYETVRQAALTRFPWTFARQRLVLADIGAEPADPEPRGPWTGAYLIADTATADADLVLDVLEVRVASTERRVAWAWHTDKDAGGTYQQYVFAETDEDIEVLAVVDVAEAEWPAYFADLVAWRLAELVAMPLTGNRDVATFALERAEIARAAAEREDRRRRPLQRVRAGTDYDLIAARHGARLAPVEGETP